MSDSFEVLKRDLQEEIDLRNEAHGESSNMSLFGVYLDMLSSSGQISDDDLTIIDSRNQGIHYAAFARDLERSEIHLFFTDYNSSSDVEKIYKKDLVELSESVLSSCLNRSQEDRDSFDAGDPIRELLDDLSDRFSYWSRLVVWMTSNKLFSPEMGQHLIFQKVV